MIFDEAKTLLSRVAIIDNRTVDAATITLWMEILDPFTLNESLWALREFARVNSQDYLRPAHLVEIIRRKRSDYAAMNPGREGGERDAWLEFENEIDRAREGINVIRATRQRYAVEAMEATDEKEE